jgi:hypothetical protein
MRRVAGRFVQSTTASPPAYGEVANSLKSGGVRGCTAKTSAH